MCSKTYIGCHVKYPYFCPVLIKIKFFGQIFDKYSNIEFHENPSGGSRVVPYGQTDGRTDGRTDRHDEANSRFSQFCGRA